MMLPKFVCDVTKFVYGVTDVFHVIIISQDYIVNGSQTSFIYEQQKNICTGIKAEAVYSCCLHLQHKLHVKGFNCNMIETS